MAGGRPTNYSPEMVEKAKHYAENFREYGDNVPMVISLCRVLNRARSTLYLWASHDDKPEFSDIFSQIEEMQHAELVNGGLSGVFNPAITKMMLTKHGYSDKQEITQETTATVKHEVSASDKFAEILKDYSKD